MVFKTKLRAFTGQYELKTTEYEVNTDQYLKSTIMSTQDSTASTTCTVFFYMYYSHSTGQHGLIHSNIK